MRNININFQKNTIEISNTFAKNASNYGSEAYNELMNARRDFPTFTVAVVKTSTKKNTFFNGLTLKNMETYIVTKSGVDSEQMKQFELLQGKTDDMFAAKASLAEIKVWFLNAYPEIEKARNNVDEIIANAKEAREARKAA